MNNDLDVRAVPAPWWTGIEFLVCSGDTTAKPLIMEKADEGVLSEPTFHLSRDKAQTLMDDLWACGLRPSEGTGSAGALAATQKHLEDMRRLVFDEKKS